MKISHTTKDNVWTDESGTAIPYNRITPTEKLMEQHSARLLKGAVSINKQLADYKALINDLSQKAFQAFMKDKEINKPSKGNFTWFNFNRTIKIEVNVNEKIEFDDLTIKAAKEKLDEFLELNIQSKNEFAKQIVMDAFETQRNKALDTKKVLNLARYKDKVNDPLFTEAVNLIEKAIRRPESRTYFRIWQKTDEGKYENVDLNLSSI